MRLIPRRVAAASTAAAMICATVVTGAVAIALLPQAAGADTGSLQVADMNSGLVAEDLAHTLAGSGVSVSNVVLTGAPNAAGTFAGGTSALGFGSGVVLGTGSVATDPSNTDPCAKGVEGPNSCEADTTQNGTPGDQDLTALAGFPTYDASVLEFDFVPAGSEVSFKYVFGSEEYPEYANSVYNDTFAFYVNGNNCALVPGTDQPVSINTINGGNPLGTNPRNPQYYVDNHFDPSAGSPLNIEMDGLTTVLTCTAPVSAGQINHMKLAIADGSDQQLDSNVFLQSASLVSAPDAVQLTPTVTGGGTSGGSISVPAGTPVTTDVTLGGPTAGTAGGSVTYWAYSDSACSTGAIPAGTKPVISGVVPPSNPVTLPPGTYYWQATYSGDPTHAPSSTPCGASGMFTVTAAVNAPPAGTASGPYVGQEGSPTTVTGSALDPNNDPVSYSWSATPLSGTDPGAACVFAAPHAASTTVTCNDDGVFTLALALSDGVNPAVPVTTTYTVSNVAPSVTVTSPAGATGSAYVGTATTVVAAFTDPGTNDTQTCQINWGNGTVSSGFVSAGTCSGSFTYQKVGVYAVTVTVTDDDGGVGKASVQLIVCDLSAKVTGGGYTTNGGQTNFGFEVQRLPDGTPKGTFELNGRGKGGCHANGDNFHGSTVGTITIVNGVAQWGGTGTFNGVNGYLYTATATDTGTPSNKPDYIKATVTDTKGNVVMAIDGIAYGGNIVVH